MYIVRRYTFSDTILVNGDLIRVSRSCSFCRFICFVTTCTPTYLVSTCDEHLYLYVAAENLPLVTLHCRLDTVPSLHSQQLYQKYYSAGHGHSASNDSHATRTRVITMQFFYIIIRYFVIFGSKTPVEARFFLLLYDSFKLMVAEIVSMS